MGLENLKSVFSDIIIPTIPTNNLSLIASANDYSPIESNDRITIPTIPTDNLSLIASANDYSPIESNDRITPLIPNNIGKFDVSDLNPLWPGPTDSIYSIPSIAGFTLNMQNTTDSQLAPGGDINNMIQPTRMLDVFGSVGSPVDFFQLPPTVAGFTLNMQNTTDSQLAPGGNITNMIQPSIMIGTFGNINTTFEKPTRDSSFIFNADNWSPIEGNDLIGVVDYQNSTNGGFTLGSLSNFPKGFTTNMINIVDSQLAPDGGPDYITPSNTISQFGELTELSEYAAKFRSGVTLRDNQSSWDALYNADHTSDTNDRLNIRYGSGLWPPEPYIVTDIGSREAGGRIFVGDRGSKDALRIASWYASPRSDAWFLTQNLFQWLNPRSHRLVNEASIFGSSIPLLGTNTKLRMSRGYDFKGGSFFGIDIGASGDIYTKTVGEITPEAAENIKFGIINQVPFWSKDKAMVAPVPWNNQLLPLPVRDQSILDYWTANESPLTPFYGWGGYGRLNFAPLPGGYPRRLKYEAFGFQQYGLQPTNFKSKWIKKPNIEEARPIYKAEWDVQKEFPAYHRLKYNDLEDGKTYRELKPPLTPLDDMEAGDRHTLMPMLSGSTLAEAYSESQKSLIESSATGMPVYFKDLRDDTYIFFRGYLSGIAESISPNWSETNYIGRSEPVWTYDKTTRDISFVLKLVAQNADELVAIYRKLNRLTSLCYPEYMKDENLKSKVRMKPPLTKFRMGELYGKPDDELTGYIKTLSYSFPDESPWETVNGLRVPKHIIATISYQIIHNKVPSLSFANSYNEDKFYGLLKGLTPYDAEWALKEKGPASLKA